ncbi:MAG TPA: NAD(P)-dependent oxidoreductase [Xanthobacteraceae bacterium]|nr:NAD(P)-dependent oxidoreductase [Xanthobacteraceae bacterium]
MSTVVITGARGYIGSALAKSLSSQGCALRLVSRATVPQNFDRASGTIDHVQADLRKEQSWQTLLDGADAVVHLSARTDLRAAEANPKEERELNVEPVEALIRAARNCRRPFPVVFASTVTIAGHAPPIPVSEQIQDEPCTVYDRHKLECETMLRDATRQGFLRACSLRLANVYGYGSGIASINSNRGILNEIMRRAGRGETLTLYGKGEYVRDFIFIGDVVDAFCRALVSDQVRDGSHYVIASGRGYTLAQAFDLVAKEALRCTRRAVEIRNVSEPSDLNSIERRNFVGDSTLFQKLTGWRAQVDLQNGIRDYFQRSLTVSRVAGAPHEAA